MPHTRRVAERPSIVQIRYPTDRSVFTMHQNFALKSGEVADGFVSACQPFSVSETSAGDFDT